MVAVVATARLGRVVVTAAQLDGVADAIALALATGDRQLAVDVAEANGVRAPRLQLSGDVWGGFEALVSVSRNGVEAVARASTKVDIAIPESGTSVLR